jgi:hypothetical protein
VNAPQSGRIALWSTGFGTAIDAAAGILLRLNVSMDTVKTAFKCELTLALPGTKRGNRLSFGSLRYENTGAATTKN